VAAGANEVLLRQPQEEDDPNSAAPWTDVRHDDVRPASAVRTVHVTAPGGRGRPPDAADEADDVVRATDGRTGVSVNAVDGTVTYG
jgi:hypothetical protein